MGKMNQGNSEKNLGFSRFAYWSQNPIDTKQTVSGFESQFGQPFFRGRILYCGI